MYYGPASDAVAYFAGLGHRCPNLYNPAGTDKTAKAPARSPEQT